jgi:hypothetical protein
MPIRSCNALHSKTLPHSLVPDDAFDNAAVIVGVCGQSTYGIEKYTCGGWLVSWDCTPAVIDQQGFLGQKPSSKLMLKQVHVHALHQRKSKPHG